MLRQRAEIMMRLYQRHHIDIGWSDLAFTVGGFLGADGAKARRDIARHWPADVSTVPCLSVRTAFDALLAVQKPAPGDEIVMSGVNIAGMKEIAIAHGVTVKAVDIYVDTLAPSADAVAAAMSERTRLILVAHLFGGRIDLAPYVRFRSENVLLVEDCAQAWTPEFRGSPEADISLFSFGPIKTITALGGAVAVLRDPGLAAALSAHLAGHPVNGNGWFARRIAKHAALKLVSHPLSYGVIYRLMRLAGIDFEEKMGAMARGFGKDGLLPKIRRQPPDVLLRLLARRLSKPSDTDARRDRGQEVIATASAAHIVGGQAVAPSHWLTPIIVADPDAARATLAKNGFDATRGTTSIRALGDNPGETPAASDTLQHMLYLPSPAQLPAAKRQELQRLVAAIPPRARRETRQP
jgi:perosamine synthetase